MAVCVCVEGVGECRRLRAFWSMTGLSGSSAVGEGSVAELPIDTPLELADIGCEIGIDNEADRGAGSAGSSSESDSSSHCPLVLS